MFRANSISAMQEQRYQNITTMKMLLLFSVLLPCFVLGQSWEKSFLPGYGYSVRQTSDGGFVVVGEASDNELIMLKVSITGDLLWDKTFGAGFNWSTSFIETADGEFVLTGKKGNAVFLMKTDLAGDTIWTRTYSFQNNHAGFAVDQTDDGGFMIIGTSTDALVKDNVLLIRTDENGDALWTKLIGGEQNISGWDGQRTADGGYVIVGRYRSNSSSRVPLIKTDHSGNVVWMKIYDESPGEWGSSVQQTSDGGYIITGTTNGQDVLLLKTDINGEITWTKTYAGSMGNAVKQTSDGGYIVTGEMNISMDESDLFLLKADDTGEALWLKQYGGEHIDYGYSVQQTSDGGFIVAGCNFDPVVGPAIYLIKTDSDGEVLMSIDIPFPNPERRLIKKIDFSGREVINPGRTSPYIEVYDDGTTQKKIK